LNKPEITPPPNSTTYATAPLPVQFATNFELVIDKVVGLSILAALLPRVDEMTE